MRPLEIALIVANFAAIAIFFGKPSQRLQLVVVGANVAFLLLQLLFEGFRWQMVASYILVVALALYVVARTFPSFASVRIPRAVKYILLTTAALVVGCTVFLVYAFPVFSLPKPTGEYAIGVEYLHLVDTSRAEPFIQGSTDARELIVKVYYPAKDDQTKPPARYFDGSPERLRAFLDWYGMPQWLFGQLLQVHTAAKHDLALPDGEQRFPVVLFSHGAGTSPEAHTAQSQELASHGYVVFAIDHPYVSWGTLFPDGLVLPRAATTNFDVPEPAEVITQIMADDVAFVIDELASINSGEFTPRFTDRLDLDAVGVVGHSVGGAVAYNLAIRDPRVKAAVDLDGVVYVDPPQQYAEMAPFLMLASDGDHIAAIEAGKSLQFPVDPDTIPAGEREAFFSFYGGEVAYREAYVQSQRIAQEFANLLASTGTLYAVTGSDHMKFTDIAHYIGSARVRELINIVGEGSPARIIEVVDAATLAFLDQHLKGASPEVFEAVVAQYPELRSGDLNR